MYMPKQSIKFHIMTDSIDKNREYEYKGLCINGFLMIFFTFILIPALIAASIITGGEDRP